MSKIRKFWISREEVFDILAGGRFPVMTIDAANVGGLTAGSIPFAGATGFLTEDNSNLFWDAGNVRLGVGIGAPVCTGHFQNAACADYAGIHPDTILLVENDDSVYIQLQGSTTANAGIIFADDDFNPPAGLIRYDFANEQIEFGVGTNEILRLKAGPTFDYAGTLTLAGIVDITGASINLKSGAEIRFYDNGNYVGFQAPALTANQIWALPDEDGNAGDVIITSGAGVLSFSAAGAGDVTAAANITDHAVVRGNGGVKGIQDSGIIIDDSDNVSGMGTLSCGYLTVTDANEAIAIIGEAIGDANRTWIAFYDSNIIRRGYVGDASDDNDDIYLASDTGDIQLIAGGGNVLISGTLIIADGAGINLQEDITFLGATTENLIKFPDALANALSFMEGANPYQTFITTNGAEAIQFHEDVLLKGSTEYGATNKTTGAWAKSIGGGGDYPDWATMFAAMPDLIAHAVTVTIEAGTTLTEICDIKNKHGITSAGIITIQAEKYYPTTGIPPTADSATATTLRDAALAAEAYGNDYFNGCWIIIIDGTGTDNGFVLITDYVDATGDVVVAAWPGTEPDNTSRYIIVGAMIDCGGTRNNGFNVQNNTVRVLFRGIGVVSADRNGIQAQYNSYLEFLYMGIYDSDGDGIFVANNLFYQVAFSGLVANNTDAAGGQAGISSRYNNYGNVVFCGISDNSSQGILCDQGDMMLINENFGDGNGAWGGYARFSGQARFVGAECSGAAGNHSDPGTAGDNNADQAAAY